MKKIEGSITKPGRTVDWATNRRDISTLVDQPWFSDNP